MRSTVLLIEHHSGKVSVAYSGLEADRAMSAFRELKAKCLADPKNETTGLFVIRKGNLYKRHKFESPSDRDARVKAEKRAADEAAKRKADEAKSAAEKARDAKARADAVAKGQADAKARADAAALKATAKDEARAAEITEKAKESSLRK